MKTAVFFVLFIVNAGLGVYLRHPIIFTFSIFALIISLLFSAKPETPEVKENSKRKALRK